jgi:urea transport system permease protein
VSINALKSWATRAYPDLWLVILGGLFILVVLFLPGGLVSIPARLKALWARFRRSPAKTAEPSSDPQPASAKT